MHSAQQLRPGLKATPSQEQLAAHDHYGFKQPAAAPCMYSTACRSCHMMRLTAASGSPAGWRSRSSSTAAGQQVHPPVTSGPAHYRAASPCSTLVYCRQMSWVLDEPVSAPCSVVAMQGQHTEHGRQWQVVGSRRLPEVCGTKKPAPTIHCCGRCTLKISSLSITPLVPALWLNLFQVLPAMRAVMLPASRVRAVYARASHRPLPGLKPPHRSFLRTRSRGIASPLVGTRRAV